jgi:crotonobetainyl-CoA:carnitine CoA-transferase CaiB-like acyl-CoA transferase
VIRFQDEPPRPDLREPRLGEHTDEVLGALKHGTPDAA